jgi:hypothetical protein
MQENFRLHLFIGFFDDDFITAVTIHREFPVPVNNSTKYIDLLIEVTTKDKILPIIIENKVESKENGSNNDQTVVYFDWCEYASLAEEAIFVYAFRLGAQMTLDALHGGGFLRRRVHIL